FGIIVGYLFDAFIILAFSISSLFYAISFRYYETFSLNEVTAQLLGIILLVGSLYWMFGQMKENTSKRFFLTFLFISSIVLFGSFFFLSNGLSGTEFLSETLGSVAATPILTFLFIVLLLISVFLIYFNLNNKRITLPELGFFSFLSLFSSFLFFSPKQQYFVDVQKDWNYFSHSYEKDLTASGFFMSIILSLLVFVFSLVVLHVGNSKNIKVIRRLGLFMFVISSIVSLYYSFQRLSFGLVSGTNILNFTLLINMFFLIYYLSRREKNENRAEFMSVVFSIVPINMFLLFLSSRTGIDIFGESVFSFDQSYIFSISLILIICFLFFYLLKISNVFKRIFYPFALSLFFFCLPFMNFNKDLLVREIELTGPALLWSFMFNFLTFLLYLGTILFGYKLKSTGIINIGAIFLFLFIISKYFDWFYSSLDKGLFFILAGVILLVVGWGMEKGRQVLISSFNEKNEI
ncbi:MAG: hypothetical protein PHD93_01545, partial [Candidatus Pacebacteria bacterium]|nr:hypothetical protein [Candidatus Paceibacterota bacterium]